MEPDKFSEKFPFIDESENNVQKLITVRVGYILT